MLFDIPFVADWHKIGDYRQRQTDHSNIRENNKCVDYDYKVGDKVLIRKDGTLRKAESRYLREPWLITSIHTNGTIRVRCGNKSIHIFRRNRYHHQHFRIVMYGKIFASDVSDLQNLYIRPTKSVHLTSTIWRPQV